MNSKWWQDVEQVYADLGWRPDKRASDLSRQFARAERVAGRHSKALAGGYLCAVDQAIWLLHRTHRALTAARRRCGKPYLIVPSAFCGAAAIQAAAIRRLYLSGFASVAAGQVRTLIETLDVATVASYDVEFAAEYHSAEDRDDARRFWHKQIARGALERRLHSVEQRFAFREAGDSTPWRWREGALAELSTAVHPTVMSAIFQFTTVTSKPRHRLRQSLFGQADLKNCRILVLSTEAVLHFSGMLFKPVATFAPSSRCAPLVRYLSRDARSELVAETSILGELADRFYPDLAARTEKLSDVE